MSLGFYSRINGEPTGKYEQISAIILLIFQQITLASRLRIDFGGQRAKEAAEERWHLRIVW